MDCEFMKHLKCSKDGDRCHIRKSPENCFKIEAEAHESKQVLPVDSNALLNAIADDLQKR